MEAGGSMLALTFAAKLKKKAKDRRAAAEAENSVRHAVCAFLPSPPGRGALGLHPLRPTTYNNRCSCLLSFPTQGLPMFRVEPERKQKWALLSSSVKMPSAGNGPSLSVTSALASAADMEVLRSASFAARERRSPRGSRRAAGTAAGSSSGGGSPKASPTSPPGSLSPSSPRMTAEGGSGASPRRRRPGTPPPAGAGSGRSPKARRPGTPPPSRAKDLSSGSGSGGAGGGGSGSGGARSPRTRKDGSGRALRSSSFKESALTVTVDKDGKESQDGEENAGALRSPRDRKKREKSSVKLQPSPPASSPPAADEASPSG
eukprot:SAG22_NODE_3433_length_1714_cov_1.362848_2_plen_317_part_00